MTAPQPSRWMRNFHPAPDARTRLICLPHAGGSASYYFPLSSALAPEFEVYSVQYPGRQDRHKEPFVDSIEDMADQVYAAVGTLPDAPTAFFGHSMGAVLAFEVTRRLEAAGRQVVTVFASGSRAPSHYGDEREYKNDTSLVDVMRQLGGTDPRVLNNPELLETFLPAFRNDYRALQAYHRGTDVTINAPIVVLSATDDPKTSEAAAGAWLDHTTAGGSGVHMFTGGHFFLEKQGQRVIEVVGSTLRSIGR